MPEVDCELYKLITMGGTDAVGFLQGQLTQDLSVLGATGQLPAAWCNPKGRVFVTLRLVASGDNIGLIVPANMADRVTQRLTMYRLRSKVDIGAACDAWTTLIPAQDADAAALIRAGVPTTSEPGGTIVSLVTIDPAATIERAPMYAPSITMAPMPIRTSSSM